MNEILEKISNAGIVPVVVIEDADNAVKTWPVAIRSLTSSSLSRDAVLKS